MSGTLHLLAAIGLLAGSAERETGMPIGSGEKRPKVEIASPSGGWTVGRMMNVEGTVSDATVDPVVVSINGARYLIRTQHGHFARQLPAASGKNVVTVLATNRGGAGRAQVTCYAQIPPVPLKVVLTSDTDGVYTDLHIYEPTGASVDGDGHLVFEKMAHVYWENTASPTGGTFFLNEQGGNFDQPGYGPYLYVHRAPPKGVYLVATNYWPSGDKAHTVAMLSLTLFEGTSQEVRRSVRVPLATPGTTRVLAWVNVLGPDRASVYVPGQEAAPGAPWPKNLDDIAQELARSKQPQSGGGSAESGELGESSNSGD